MIRLFQLAFVRQRKLVVSRYAGTTNATTAETVIRLCLLTEAGDELLEQLSHFGEVTANALETTAAGKNYGREKAAWHAYALALLAYRKADYDSAYRWCNRALDYDRGILVRDVSVQLIRAMACARLGRMDEAKADLKASRGPVEDDAKRLAGLTAKWQGYWFDWACARILLREAAALIETDSGDSN